MLAAGGNAIEQRLRVFCTHRGEPMMVGIFGAGWQVRRDDGSLVHQ
ncbi:MAG: hypothetical protein CM1200mP9_10850 [Gammaproteobacteria bacterium]|nr:MAG: hypothetical protein CM1200mP9_10850 [Gammaproteobacteria bacterium]